MNNFKLNLGIVAIAASVLFSSCDNDYEKELPTIAGIAVESPNFSTLEGAAILGGVAVTLSNKNANDPNGNFTVFAPTNAAFAKLGLTDEGSLNALQGSFLTNTLLYHVSNGNLPSGAITAGGASLSAIGVQRRFIVRGNDKYINGSKIVATDVAASNGTVHAIDKVMIATGVDIVQSALLLNDKKVFKTAELTFLVQAVVSSGLASSFIKSRNSYRSVYFRANEHNSNNCWRRNVNI